MVVTIHTLLRHPIWIYLSLKFIYFYSYLFTGRNSNFVQLTLRRIQRLRVARFFLQVKGSIIKTVSSVSLIWQMDRKSSGFLQVIFLINSILFITRGYLVEKLSECSLEFYLKKKKKKRKRLKKKMGDNNVKITWMDWTPFPPKHTTLHVSWVLYIRLFHKFMLKSSLQILFVMCTVRDLAVMCTYAYILNSCWLLFAL